MTYTYLGDGTRVAARAGADASSHAGKRYRGTFVYDVTSGGVQSLESVAVSTGRLTALTGNNGAVSFESDGFITDHLGNVAVVVNLSASSGTATQNAILEQNEYTPFGTKLSVQGLKTQAANRWRYAGKEEQDIAGMNLRLLDFGARYYDSFTCRWNAVDPLAHKSVSFSSYHYCANDPINYRDIDGRDTVHVADQKIRPQDNGIPGTTYTAIIYVVQNGSVSGPYLGSSYPNSKSNSDNSTLHNTVTEGNHHYNNKSGHKGGTQKGLNIDDSKNGSRTTSGFDPNGKECTILYANVHTGASDNGNSNSRGSKACVTIHPEYAEAFFANFSWDGEGNTGTSEGTIIIDRTIAPAIVTANRKSKKE